MIRRRRVCSVIAAALGAVTVLLSEVVVAQPPALDHARVNPSRAINEVLFEFLPAQYVSIPSISTNPLGAQIYELRLANSSTGAVSETIPVGEKYSDRRLVGAWTDSYGAFRFTRQPPSSVPFNRTAGTMLRPVASTDRLELVGRTLRDYGTAYPHTQLTVFANGVSQGTVTMRNGERITYTYTLALQDRFTFRMIGAGSATVQALYLYDSSSGTPQAIKSLESLSVQVPAGGSTVSHLSTYAGRATDCALRVQASGVDSSSRMQMLNGLGAVVLDVPVASGSSVVTSEEADPLRRAADVRVSYAPASPPSPANTNVAWADHMKWIPTTWRMVDSTAEVASDGEIVGLQGLANAIHSFRMELPSTIHPASFPYLSVRVKVTPQTIYYLRPSLDDAAAWAEGTALEARRGTGEWQTVTFNLQTLVSLYSPPASTINRFELVIAPDPYNPPAGTSIIRMETDWMALTGGIVPDGANPAVQETLFSNSLDDDNDGLVDRDDDNFRKLHPVSVHANYQLLVRDGNSFRGYRRPAPGEPGNSITVDPSLFSPVNQTKRQILSTFYPLDFVGNPNYEPPGNYDEMSGRLANGNWNPYNNPALPPTEQLTGLNYQQLGAVEEYNILSDSWVTAQLNLARRYGLDGFIYQDGGLNNSVGHEEPIGTMARLLQGGAWKYPDFLYTSFYGMMAGDRTLVADVVRDLGYISKYRASQVPAYLRKDAKPVIFAYPMLNTNMDDAEWEQIFAGLLNLPLNNFDGAVRLPAAKVGADNILSFTFDRWWELPGAPWSGALDGIIWYDRDMRVIGEVDVGSAQEHAALLLDGWAADEDQGSFDSTNIQQWAPGGTPGYARMKLSIPANAWYMRMHMRAWGNGPEVGGIQQYCELRVNTAGGTPAIRFATRRGWDRYLFRLRDLPTGFAMNGVTDTPHTELPVSIWGENQNLVRKIDAPRPHTRGLDGYATYGSSFRDSRVEVSFPYLYASTVRPSFDDSGLYYYNVTSQHYLEPRRKGATYRGEWERLIRNGADVAIVTSWNEYQEATNIEPDIENGFSALRLTLTYSLIYKGVISTGKLPSATGFLVRQFDLNTADRVIEFTIGGADTIRVHGQKFGYDGELITGITRNGTPVALGSAEASVASGSMVPTLTINSPSGTSTYRISCRLPLATTAGWVASGHGADATGGVEYDFDDARQALRIRVYSATTDAQGNPTRYRTGGWYSDEIGGAMLPYASVGASNYVRLKYYVYATGQQNPSARNQIPAFSIRASNRFAMTANMEITPHNNAMAWADPITGEIAPSTNPDQPSVYRVDYDPPDIPYLISNAATEGIWRGFVAFSIDPQENGYLGLSECSAMVYSASLLADTPESLKRTYTAADGDFNVFQAAERPIYNLEIPAGATEGGFLVSDSVGPLATHTLTTTGSTYDSANVPSNRIGIIEHYFNVNRGGAIPASSLPRVAEGKQYKIRFHLTSTQQTNRQAPFWMYGRTLGYAWGQKLEFGGAYLINDASNPNDQIGWQAMPGVGTAVTDGWYNMILVTPMTADVRPESPAGSTVAQRMPQISALPGPGAAAASPLRDIGTGVMLVDTLNMGLPNANRYEKGNYTVDRVEVREYSLVPD